MLFRSEALATQTQGVVVGTYRAGEDPVPIRLRSPQGSRYSIDQLLTVNAYGNGQAIPVLDTGQATPDTVFDFGTPRQGPDGIYYVYEVDGAEIIDPNHDESRLNLVRSYAVSANAAFARLGDEMPPQVMLDYAGQMGFSPPDGPPPLETGMAASQLANFPQAIFENNVLRAATAFGQGELLTTPLQMALVVAGVVNQGNIPTPHFLERVQAPGDRKSTRLNSSHSQQSRMPSSA